MRALTSTTKFFALFIHGNIVKAFDASNKLLSSSRRYKRDLTSAWQQRKVVSYYTARVYSQVSSTDAYSHWQRKRSRRKRSLWLVEANSALFEMNVSVKRVRERKIF